MILIFCRACLCVMLCSLAVEALVTRAAGDGPQREDCPSRLLAILLMKAYVLRGHWAT